jgi:hypothetical protein
MNGQQSKTLLSTAYLPPISWFKIMLGADEVLLEQHENFIKQSYRNRCNILAANGVLALSIPLVKPPEIKVNIKDIKIDYKTDWQKQHLKSIESAYRNSPFYEYLIDDFIPIYQKKPQYLFEFNLLLINTVLKIIEIDKKIGFTDNFFVPNDESFDFRYRIKPKKQSEEITHLANKEYYQVFNSKHPFQPDLSIIDLLFNLGSETYGYLMNKQKGF